MSKGVGCPEPRGAGGNRGAEETTRHAFGRSHSPASRVVRFRGLGVWGFGVLGLKGLGGQGLGFRVSGRAGLKQLAEEVAKRILNP